MKKLSFILLAVLISACSKAPQAPSNLRAVDVQHNLVVLEWQDNSDNETEFVILRNYDQFDRTLRNFYTDSLIKPATDYRYTVRAVNKYGHSDSNPIELRTPERPAPPAPPDSLIANRDFTSIAITWRDNATTEKSYVLDVDGWTFELPANTTNWTHTNLDPNSTHTYIIWTRNNYGHSDSLKLTATTRGKFTATWNRSLDRKSVNNEIIPNGPAAGYELTVTAGDTAFVAYAGKDTSASFIVGAPFCATVRAYDDANNYSTHSDIVCKD